MGCFSERLQVDFKCKKDAQKYLIEFILSQGNYDLKALADLPGIDVIELSVVLSGKYFLEDKPAADLMKWFLLFIGE